MKTFRVFMLTVLTLLIVTSINLFAQKTIKKDFDKKDKIRLKLALGSCVLQKSNDGKIHVDLSYTFDDDEFEPVFKERGSTLTLQEKFHGNNNHGYADWKVFIPDGIEIDFNSGTGSLALENVSVEIDGSSGTGSIEINISNGDFDLNSGTGTVEVIDSQGDFDLNSGTGRVSIKSSTGNFKANSGTGRVRASDITIEDDADFNSGIGEVEVIGPKGQNFSLSVNSGTNDAILDLDGQPVKGYFEFTANKRRGDIKSPFKFDNEEEYENGNGITVKKSFTKGGDSPQYFISTGTGTAELKK